MDSEFSLVNANVDWFDWLAPHSIKFKKLVPDAIIPTRGNKHDAGYDLYLLEDHRLGPGEFARLRTGVAVELNPMLQAVNVDASPVFTVVGLVRARSSAFAKGMMIQGTIDQGYRGELMVQVWNVSSGFLNLKTGDRIAQLVVVPSVILPTKEVQELTDSDRGTGAFGSTGK